MKFNISNITAIVSLIALLGGGKIIMSYKESAIQNSVIQALSDPDSKISILVKREAENKAKEIMAYEMKSTANKLAFVSAFKKAFGNMTDKEALLYVQNMFNWADTIKSKWSMLESNHVWINEKRSEEKDGLETCAYVLCMNGNPKYFKSCSGGLKPIYHGKLNRMSSKVYYYRDNNDNAIVLTYLSRIITN